MTTPRDLSRAIIASPNQSATVFGIGGANPIRQKGLFVMRFLRRIGEGGEDWRNGMTFLVKSIERPSVQPQTEEINQYNKKRVIHTGVKYTPVTCTLYDTADGAAQVLWAQYASYYFGDYRQEPGSYRDDIINQRMNDRGRAGYGYGIARTNASEPEGINSQFFFDSVEVYQVWGGEYVAYRLLNPKITNFNPDELDYEQSGPATVSMTLQYEGIFHENGGRPNNISRNQTLVEIFRGQFSGNVYEPVGSEPRLTRFDSRLRNILPRSADALARALTENSAEAPSSLELSTLPTSTGGSLNRFGTFAFGDFATLGSNLPSDVSTMIGNQEPTSGVLGQDAFDIPDVANAIGFAANASGTSPNDVASFNRNVFAFDTPPSDGTIPPPAPTEGVVTEDKSQQRRGLSLSPVVMAAVNSRSDGTSQIGKRSATGNNSLRFIREPTPARRLSRPLVFGRVSTPIEVRASLSGGRGVQLAEANIVGDVRIFADIQGGLTPGGFILSIVRVNSETIGRVDPIGSINAPIIFGSNIRGRLRVTGTINRPVIVSANIQGRGAAAGQINAQVQIGRQIIGSVPVLRSSIFSPVLIVGTLVGRTPVGGFILTPVRVDADIRTAVEAFGAINGQIAFTANIVGRPVVSGTINRPVIISSNIRALTFSGVLNGIVQPISQISALTSWGSLNGQVIIDGELLSDTAPSATINGSVNITPTILGQALPSSTLLAPVIISMQAVGQHRFGVINGVVNFASNISSFVFPSGSLQTPVIVESQIFAAHRFGIINSTVVISMETESVTISPRIGTVFSSLLFGTEIFAVKPNIGELDASMVVVAEAAGVSVVTGQISSDVIVNAIASSDFTLRREGNIDATINIIASGIMVAPVNGDIVGETIITSASFASIPVNGPIEASVNITGAASGSVVTLSDPFFENVIFLLQPDGDDGDSSFVDASSRRNAVFTGGLAQMSTTTRKFSPASLETSDDFISVMNDPEFTLSADFTVEAFVRFRSLTPNAAIMGKWSDNPANTSWLLSIEANELRFTYVDINDTLVSASFDWTARQTDTWYHIAATRFNDRTRIFINGVQVGSTVDADPMRDSSADFVVGNIVNIPNYGLDGFMDQVRVTANIARYTSNFLVPVSAFPSSSGNIVEFVGAKTYTQASGVEQIITFDNLSGGIDTTARSGDTCIVYVLHGRERTAAQNLALVSNPASFDVYGPFLANDQTNNSNSLEALVAVRQLAGPAPTTTRIRAPSTNSAGVIQIMVFRNVAGLTFHSPLTVETFENTNLPNPSNPFITRTGTAVVTAGGGGVPNGMPLYNDPSELTFTSKATTSGSEKNHVMSLMGFALDPAPGVNFDLTSWTSPVPAVPFNPSLSAALAISFALEPRSLATELPSLPLSTNIRYWFRADKDLFTDLSGTIEANDEDRIAVWKNQGTQEDAIQSDSLARPSYEVDLGVNRLPSVRAFDGYFEDLLQVGQPNGFTTLRPFTVFAVCDRLPPNFTNPNPILGRSGDKASLFLRNNEGQNIQVFKSDFRFGGIQPYYVIGASVRNLTSFRRSLNGAGVNTGGATNPSFNNSETIPFLTDPLDWTTAGVRNIFQGNLYEFIYFDGALTDQQYEIVNSYLLSRYTPRLELTDPAVFDGSTTEEDDVCQATGDIVGEVDEFWNYTAALINGAGDDGSTLFNDRSKYARTTTGAGAVINDATVTVGTAPSIRHNASGNHVRREYGTELDISGANGPDFCMEAYVRCNDVTAFNTILGRRRDVDNYWMAVTNNRLQFTTFAGTTATNRLDVAADLTNGQQHHIAVIRVGQTYYGFVDGVLKGSNLSSGTMQLNANTDLFIGESDTNVTRFWRGNTNWIRLTIGRSRYSIAGFTPPSLPLGDEAPPLLPYPSSTSMNGVVLLTGFEAQTSTAYREKSLFRRQASFFGNAVIAIDSPFAGGRSLLLDGAGDFITFPHAPELSIDVANSARYTMEAWVKPTNLTGSRTIASKRASNGSGEFTLSVVNGRPTFRVFDGTTLRMTLQAAYQSAPLLQVNTWHHIAVCANGGFHTLFIDGKLVQTACRTSATTNNTAAFHIGRDPSATTQDWAGLIDDFRFTQGAILYEDSFVLPTSPAPHPTYLDSVIQEDSDTVEVTTFVVPPPLVSGTGGWGMDYGFSWGAGLSEENDTLDSSGSII